MKNKLLLTSMTTIVGLYSMLLLFLTIIFNLAGISLSYLLIGSILFLFLQFLIAPYLMDIVMKCFYGVKFDKDVPEYLKKYVSEVCEKNNMKYPKIGYIDDSAPNAFTYGRSKNDARIIVTKGVYELLNEDEVKAVVSHEIGHAVHYDMFLMTAVEIVPFVLYFIYNSVLDSDDDDKGGAFIIAVISYVLYIISQYVILWFSRTREYYADEFAIRLTGKPNSLASALVKIGYGLTTAKNEDSSEEESKKENKYIKNMKKRFKNRKMFSVAAFGIFDSKASKSLVVSSFDEGSFSKDNIKRAARWELWNPWAKLYEFNSTHPLISKRIKAICKYSNEYNESEYIIFDEKKPERYFDDFVIEIFIKFLPMLVIITFSVIGFLGYNFISNILSFIGLGFIVLSLSLLISHNRSHKNKDYKEMMVSDLLSEVKVSSITSVPCVIKGKIIGKGEPGYIFSEDFVIQDETGIIFLDYSQPLIIIDKLFALFKSKKYVGKSAEVKGWYRRSPVPYIQIYSMKIDEKVMKCYTYAFTRCFIYILLIIGIILFALYF